MSNFLEIGRVEIPIDSENGVDVQGERASSWIRVYSSADVVGRCGWWECKCLNCGLVVVNFTGTRYGNLVQ